MIGSELSNSYAYSANDPINKTDVSGLASKEGAGVRTGCPDPIGVLRDLFTMREQAIWEAGFFFPQNEHFNSYQHVRASQLVTLKYGRGVAIIAGAVQEVFSAYRFITDGPHTVQGLREYVEDTKRDLEMNRAGRELGTRGVVFAGDVVSLPSGGWAIVPIQTSGARAIPMKAVLVAALCVALWGCGAERIRIAGDSGARGAHLYVDGRRVGTLVLSIDMRNVPAPAGSNQGNLRGYYNVDGSELELTRGKHDITAISAAGETLATTIEPSAINIVYLDFTGDSAWVIVHRY